MTRPLATALFVVSFAATAQAQGPLERAGQALEDAGRNIREGVDNAAARRQINAAERELLGRVSQRLSFDKYLAGSALQLTVRADGAVVLQGAVTSEAARKRAGELAESTLGVTAVVDELAVAKSVNVIRPARVVVLPVETEVVVPPVVAPIEVVVPVQKAIVKP